MVRCEDGSHYTGITTDPRRRMREHVLRLTPGAKYTKSHRVIALDALWSAQTRSEACRLESAVKRLRAEQKRALIAQPDQLHDFLGARIDASRYNDGQRGGVVKVRAKIEKLDPKTLVIREVPFTKTAESVQDSITKAVEKGKLKIRRVDDMTSSQVEIQVHLAPGTSSDKTIDALYAFTDCEINISPNCCVIDGQKPQFLTVSDVLRRNVDHTKELLRQELEIRRHELLEQLFFASLEQIFIEERIYKGKPFENAKDTDQLIAYIDERLQPFYPSLVRAVGREDLLRLLEIKMQRIAKFSKDKNEELIAKIRAEIARIEKDLSEMTRVTVEWFEMLKEKYGKDHPRRTEIKSFDTIIAAKVAERNEKLYIDRQAGFIGTGLKKAELVENCSDIDDVIIFYRDGKYKVIKIQDKVFVGKNILHVQVFKKNDHRTIFNLVYRDGQATESMT